RWRIRCLATGHRQAQHTDSDDRSEHRPHSTRAAKSNGVHAPSPFVCPRARASASCVILDVNTMQLLLTNRNSSWSTVHANSMPADHSARRAPTIETENSNRVAGFLPILVRYIRFSADSPRQPRKRNVICLRAGSAEKPLRGGAVGRAVVLRLIDARAI